MKLSMSLIANYLKDYHPECHILNDALSIKGVRFLAASRLQFSLEYIYLGEAEGYYQDPRYAGALLLANGENQIICRGADREDLLNNVLSAFDFYAEFEQKLFLASARHWPLEQMMSIMKTVLDCTILVFDINGGLLGSLLMDDAEKRKDLANIVRQKKINLTEIGSIIMEANGRVSHDLTDEPQYMYLRDMDLPGCVSMYLSQEGERIGFIMLFVKERSQVPLCLCLEPMLANCCASASEFTEKTSLHQSSNAVFLSLLNGEVLSPAVTEKFAADIQIGENAVLMVFQSISIRNYTFHKMLLSEIHLLEVPCLACEHEGRIVILVSEGSLDAVIRLISSRIPSSNIAIGISMRLQDLNRISLALSQAVFALNASDEPGIRRCRDLALPFLLKTLKENEMTSRLLHPALGILEKYDRENHTELLPTLSVYVQTGGSQTDAASALHVHLNTLKYRLGRIGELTQVNFKNQEELFYILLSLKLRE